MGPGKELGFTLIATEAHETFNQECDITYFTSLKDYLFYSMEKGIAVMRIGKRGVAGGGHFSWSCITMKTRCCSKAADVF